MKIHLMMLAVCLWGIGTAQAQVQEKEKEYIQKQTEVPKAMDFSKIFEQKETERDEYAAWQKQRQEKLRERLERAEALEKAVDPDAYIVGPEDIFSFNVWELGIESLLKVNPEGKLLIPSAGEVRVDGKTLAEVQDLVLSRADSYFRKSRVTFTLEGLRFFRVHVVGEVQFPGTYVAQAVDRISEMITEAGGTTEWAWKGGVELRREGLPVHRFDLSRFEQEGILDEDLYVNGGDVIYVPPITLSSDWVTLEGDLEHAGTYQIAPDEALLDFLNRVRALNRNTDLGKIVVVRPDTTENGGSVQRTFTPYEPGRGSGGPFLLRNRDRVVLPSRYVYVKGSVRLPGAYPFSMHLTAKDYAGMAGGDFRSGNIKSVRVFHVRTGKTEKGPDARVEPGDVVHLNPSWNFRFENYIRIIPTITSLILAAKAAGFLGD
jgi:polysaccharide export outer membrane protein